MVSDEDSDVGLKMMRALEKMVKSKVPITFMTESIFMDYLLKGV